MNNRKTIKVNINANLFNISLVLLMGFFIGILFHKALDNDSKNPEEYVEKENIILKDFDIKNYLTDVEIALFESYYADYSTVGYKTTEKAIKKSRLNKIKYTSKIPFCDVLDILEIEESPSRTSVKKGDSILKQWERIHSKPLRLSCEQNYIPAIEKSNVETFEIDSTDIITIQGKKLISSKKVSELISLANTCELAKTKIVEFKGDNKYISAHQYENILKLELDCAYLEINKK